MYPSPENPAYGVFVRRQVEALRELGVEVDLVRTAIGRPGSRLGTKAVQLAWHTLRGVRRGFDLVHVHFPTIAGVCGVLASWARRTPLVLTLHGAELDDAYLAELKPWKAWLTKRMALAASRRADAIVAVGRDVADKLVSDGVPSNRIQVFDMGVDCRLFRPRPKTEARRDLGLDESGPLIVFAGWLIAVKGPEYFVRAAALLRDCPACRWYLVGGGSPEAMLALAEELGVGDRVISVGQRRAEDMPLWFAAADVMVMPSLTEPFGLAALEALACGTPVVASNVGGLRSFVVDGRNGYLVGPRSATDIAARVRGLLADSGLRERMGRNGVQAAQQHELRVQARKVIDVYESVLGARRIQPATLQGQGSSDA